MTENYIAVIKYDPELTSKHKIAEAIENLVGVQYVE
jgi:hypothetical protein